MGRKLQVLVLSLIGSVSLGAYAQEAREAMQNVRESCQSDVQTLCPDAANKGPRVLGRCMRDHSDSLSDACRTSLGELQALRKPE